MVEVLERGFHDRSFRNGQSKDWRWPRNQAANHAANRTVTKIPRKCFSP